ncbi:hypothetical protein N836_08760 [Leptolyngbya sp. Heron Island J]|uniref:ribbon-helix-helix domain-containing protein n=1 Tax=Leptolyngbya sp. Heron Island J TaxID=1385935 RepID=UPI0003B9A743|nr:hypothetical protein [Leptolyngbya sp. Heron Island J]ESA36061.1 hypothetical protein N836_08760 [Leptolyngbya sp. Heron Island J]
MTAMTKRVQVTLPDRLAEALEQWAAYDGRPLSNLCAFLLEKAVLDAKQAGVEWSESDHASDKSRK